MRPQLFRWFSGIAGLVLLGWLVQRAGTEEIAAAFLRIDPAWLLIWLALFFAVAFGIAWRWSLLVRALGMDVRVRDLLAMWFCGVTVGSATAGAKLGGDPLRAWLLARKVQDGSTGRAIASVIADRGIELTVNLIFAIGYCMAFALGDPELADDMLRAVLAIAVLQVLLVAFLVARLKARRSLVPMRFGAVFGRFPAGAVALGDAEAALRELLFDRRSQALRAVAAATLVNALVLVEFAVAFRVFGAAPDFPQLAGSIMGVGLAHAIPVPGSVGTLEGAQAIVFGVGGGTATLAVIAAIVARMRDIVRAIPGAVLLLFRRF